MQCGRNKVVSGCDTKFSTELFLSGIFAQCDRNVSPLAVQKMCFFSENTGTFAGQVHLWMSERQKGCVEETSGRNSFARTAENMLYAPVMAEKLVTRYIKVWIKHCERMKQYMQ